MTRGSAADTVKGSFPGHGNENAATSPPPELQTAASYLDALGDEGSLPDELAQLAEDSDHRPLMRHERDLVEKAIYLCAAAIRRARPPIVRAALEGRFDG